MVWAAKLSVVVASQAKTITNMTAITAAAAHKVGSFTTATKATKTSEAPRIPQNSAYATLEVHSTKVRDGSVVILANSSSRLG